MIRVMKISNVLLRQMWLLGGGGRGMRTVQEDEKWSQNEVALPWSLTTTTLGLHFKSLESWTQDFLSGTLIDFGVDKITMWCYSQVASYYGEKLNSYII